MRADTFSSKEPEILSWIDRYGSDDPFWDIGSNIGLYSIYYGLTKSGRVLSFEPSVFNLKQLAKNISLNGLSEKIDLNPIPLSKSTGYSGFSVSSLVEGNAQNAFGVNYGFDGNNLHQEVNYSVLGMSGDEIIKNGYVDKIPKMIKLDVDGIEHLILEGMKKILLSKNCYSVFVEVNDDFQEQAIQVKKILTESGFELSEKTHAEMHDHSTKYSKTYNQIWFKI
jgi:FkbM family methyltransferase